MRPWIAVLAAATPLALLPLVSTGSLPRPLAFVLDKGQWLVALAIVGTAACALWPGQPPLLRAVDRASLFMESRPRRALLVASALAAFLVATLALPDWRRVGAASGDEPKYLRIAQTLRCDLDVDIQTNRRGPLRPDDLAANLRQLGRSSRVAVRALWRGERPPEEHEWSLGGLAVAAWRGGVVYALGPGLPALVAVLPEPAERNPAPWALPRPVLALLAGLFALTVAQTAALGAEVSGSSRAGLLAASFVAASPAVFVVGYHLYPEAMAAVLLPLLARYARRNGPPLGPARAVALGLVAGGLPWLHVKFLPVGLVAAGFLAARLWRCRGALVALVASVGLALASFLLFQFSITGLLRPDAHYVRLAHEVWQGTGSAFSWKFVSGLGNALFGARDGLLVMAPALVASLLAGGRLWRRDPATARLLLAMAATHWLTVSIHGGGAPGPPGRLMAPVAGLLAAPLAVGMVELRSRLAFRWSVVALVLVGVMTTAAMGREWRRTVKPYRRAVTDATNIQQDLPAGRGGPTRALGDLARAGLLGGLIAFWARRLSTDGRPRGPHRPRWHEALSYQAAAWGTVVVAAVGLQGITSLTGPG
jgi:hypothetical protein